MKPSEGLAGQEAQLARLAHGLEVARAERNVALRERDEERHRLNEVLKEREAVLVEFVQQRDKARMAFEQMAADVLAALAGAGIATPEKGYAVEPWAVRGDIGRLAMKCEAVQVDSKNLRHALGQAIASESRVRRVLKAMEERHPGEVDVEWTADLRSGGGAGLCLEQCSGSCGFGHLRGCDAINEWIQDNRADASHAYECVEGDPKPTPEINIQPVSTPPDRPNAKRQPRAHDGSPTVVSEAAEVPDEQEHERSAAVELALKELGAKP
jgi:hypothetical protein